MKNKILILWLICFNVFAIEVVNSPVNGGVAIIDFKTNLANPKAYFYDNRVLVQKLENNKFRAIVGIPISAKAGIHQLKIADFNTRFIDFKIQKADYKKQYITLKGKKKKFVDLNKTQLQRVLNEKKILANAKNTWSQKLLATDFQPPAKGVITGVFGSQRFFNNKPRRPHMGYDIANKLGTDITAITGGEVVLVGDFYFNGKTVLIDHGRGLLSIYIHLNKTMVKAGDLVKVGDKIATMGQSGRATGANLHLGIYLNKVAVNPQLFTQD